jgi:hypothetical protein
MMKYLIVYAVTMILYQITIQWLLHVTWKLNVYIFQLMAKIHLKKQQSIFYEEYLNIYIRCTSITCFKLCTAYKFGLVSSVSLLNEGN